MGGAGSFFVRLRSQRHSTVAFRHAHEVEQLGARRARAPSSGHRVGRRALFQRAVLAEHLRVGALHVARELAHRRNQLAPEAADALPRAGVRAVRAPPSISPTTSRT